MIFKTKKWFHSFLRSETDFFLILCYHARHLQQIHLNENFCRMYSVGVIASVATLNICQILMRCMCEGARIFVQTGAENFTNYVQVRPGAGVDEYIFSKIFWKKISTSVHSQKLGCRTLQIYVQCTVMSWQRILHKNYTGIPRLVRFQLVRSTV